MSVFFSSSPAQPRTRLSLWVLVLLLLGLTCAPAVHRAAAAGPSTPYPILFVTQVPIRADFTTIGAVFGNHHADMQSVARGGDLWIRYPDGTLRNLTQEAGYGSTGQQGANAI